MFNLALAMSISWCPVEFVYVSVREDGAADEDVILFTEVNDSISTICDVIYSMPSHDSFSVLLAASSHCFQVSMQELDVVIWNICSEWYI